MKINTNSRTERSKGRVGYGVKVPELSFQEIIRIVKEVATKGGLNGSLDVLSRVFGNSRSSSVFTKKLSAMKNFGLLTSDPDEYELQDIARLLVQPDSPEQETMAIYQAFTNHDLLNRVLNNYKGKLLPQREYLANHFEKALGIPSSLKEKWADYFIEAAKYAGLLHEREAGSYQVFSQPVRIKEKIPEEQETSTKDLVGSGQQPQHAMETTDPIAQTISSVQWGILNQRRVSGNRRAIIAIPDDLTETDIETIKVILKGVEAGLEGLKKHEE